MQLFLTFKTSEFTDAIGLKVSQIQAISYNQGQIIINFGSL
jgi:hypothetical protein